MFARRVLRSLSVSSGASLLALVMLSQFELAAQELPAQGGQQEPAPKLETVQDKASYGFGYQIGRQFRGQGMTVSVQTLLRGLQDGLGGRKSALADNDLFAAMAEHQRTGMTQLAKRNKEEGEAFLKANLEKKGVVGLESGLQYAVIQQGKGPTPKPTDRVRTHYHGTLIDGTVFDSSVEAGQPATFGVSEVIPGWTEALVRMKVGDKWRLFIPSEMAYGVQGAPPDIGPNSVLIFDIELLSIE
jgi:FKBP-type peptidyl-prolyl cis-trans isomerase FklB